MMTMEETATKEELPNVDFARVAALQQKRTLAFVNHFVTTNIQFLNSFLSRCEQKLMQFEKNLERVEAAMILLETRLASIPEVNTDQLDSKQESMDTSSEQQKNEQDSCQPPENALEPSDDTAKDNVVQPQPEYERFVKMVQVGVPIEAVKLKVSMEGLDPNILEKILKK